MIPIYTTDGVPIANAGPVERAWPVWTDEAEIGHGLDRLAYQAAQQGAHAIAALKITAYWVPAGDTYSMPGRTVQDLIPRARHQRDREHLRHDAAPHQGHQRTRLAGRRVGHGVQTDRAGPGPPARSERSRLVALVRAGARFERGRLVERPEGAAA